MFGSSCDNRDVLRFFCAFLIPTALFCQTVRFSTTQGDIDVQLLPDTAPQTVANFLKYMNRGAFNGTIIHRSVPDFVIQGGGYKVEGNRLVHITEDAPVQNEFRLSNTRGTIAMAKVADKPNSATSEWFFNLKDNGSNLDSQNGGFTVFGRITNDAGLAVIDKIATLPRSGNPADAPIQPDLKFVTVTSIAVITAPAISANGVISAGGFGGFSYAAPGSFIEIYGTNLAGGTARSWASSDFSNGNAPTSLDQVSVTVGGKPAFVNYISSGQVNVQVPADVDLGSAVPVVLTNRGSASSAVNMEIRPMAPGLLAPATFKVGDKQFVVGVRANGTLVGPDSKAVPGEALTFYGVGFGPVTGSVPIAGRVVDGQAPLLNPVRFRIGGTDAQVTYAGLAPSLVGLYQFNLVVPASAESGDLPVQVTLGDAALPQTLYLPVARP